VLFRVVYGHGHGHAYDLSHFWMRTNLVV
jgi:hypothetical protein